MKVVVTGGTGHIGTYLVPMLINEGYDVTVVTRGDSKPYEDHPAWRKAKRLFMDRGKDPDFEKKIAQINPDIVIDLIGFQLEETRKMVEALKETGCSHFLYCSSCWAHGMGEILPADPDSLTKEPICDYGREKFKTELYLKEEYRKNGFPSTVIMPGQISGPGYTIISPWANATVRPVRMIADGKEIKLPNFGMETLHHVHGEDVAQLFMKAVKHRNQALGETFDAQSGQSITLYGMAKLLYQYFGQEPKISFLPWPEWTEHEGNPDEVEQSRLHMMRSGSFDIQKERKLLEYEPKHSNVETILEAVGSYIDRGVIKRHEPENRFL